MHINVFESMKGRNHLEDPGIDGIETGGRLL
jgi:hypothetical protein